MDTNPASSFLSRLFAPYPSDRGLTLEFRATMLGTGEIVQKWFATSSEYVENAARFATSLAESANVYMGVLPRQGRGGKKSDVRYCAYLPADVDGGEEGFAGVTRLMRGWSLPAPDMVVESGNGAHVYWRLTEPILLDGADAVARVEKAMRRLCLAIGGEPPGAHADTQCTDVPRVLRVPGTMNHKHGQKKPVLYTVIGGEPKPLEWFEARLPMERERKPLFERDRIEANRAQWGGGVTPGLERWADDAIAEGQRHNKLRGHARWLKRECNLSESEAYALFLRKINACNRGAKDAIDSREAEGLWNWA